MDGLKFFEQLEFLPFVRTNRTICSHRNGHSTCVVISHSVDSTLGVAVLFWHVVGGWDFIERRPLVKVRLVVIFPSGDQFERPRWFEGARCRSSFQMRRKLTNSDTCVPLNGNGTGSRSSSIAFSAHYDSFGLKIPVNIPNGSCKCLALVLGQMIFVVISPNAQFPTRISRSNVSARRADFGGRCLVGVSSVDEGIHQFVRGGIRQEGFSLDVTNNDVLA